MNFSSSKRDLQENIDILERYISILCGKKESYEHESVTNAEKYELSDMISNCDKLNCTQKILLNNIKTAQALSIVSKLNKGKHSTIGRVKIIENTLDQTFEENQDHYIALELCNRGLIHAAESRDLEKLLETASSFFECDKSNFIEDENGINFTLDKEIFSVRIKCSRNSCKGSISIGDNVVYSTKEGLLFEPTCLSIYHYLVRLREKLQNL
jgi:hypothetical protein